MQHAALVQVRPKDGSALRFEVLTAQAMSLQLSQVAWFDSGLPPIEPRLVLVRVVMLTAILVFVRSTGY